MNVIAAVEQARVRVHPTDGRFAGDHSFQARAIRWFGFVTHGALNGLIRIIERSRGKVAANAFGGKWLRLLFKLGPSPDLTMRRFSRFKSSALPCSRARVVTEQVV